ncbi:MAG: hypothetical protein O3A58_00670 [Proteobacteria bacterium]|nr:hypothetical protein [Pseudomonadota bacterium]
MSPEKEALINSLVDEINHEKILLTVDINDLGCFTTEIAAIASKYPNLSSCSLKTPSNVFDPTGQDTLDRFEDNITKLLADELSLNFKGVSREINFVINQDAHKYHQDHSATQFKYLTHLSKEEAIRTNIVQDLTLVDWDMSEGTFSGTVFQDSESFDRYIFPLFPKDILGMVFTQSPKYLSRDAHPSYNIPTIFPYHAVLSPIDYSGSQTPGSSKGKRISTVVRGVVPKSEVDDLASKTTTLKLNRPITQNENQYSNRNYSNGMTGSTLNKTELNEISSILRAVYNVQIVDDKENTVTFEIKDTDTCEALFKIVSRFFSSNYSDSSEVRIFIANKMDGGFSSMNCMNLGIQNNSSVFILNLSDVPEGYDYFHIAQDFTKQGFPWIQLYHFPPYLAYQLSGESLKKLSLTPLEEILFREAKADSSKTDGMNTVNKFRTKILIIAINSKV